MARPPQIPGIGPPDPKPEPSIPGLTMKQIVEHLLRHMNYCPLTEEEKQLVLRSIIEKNPIPEMFQKIQKVLETVYEQQKNETPTKQKNKLKRGKPKSAR